MSAFRGSARLKRATITALAVGESPLLDPTVDKPTLTEWSCKIGIPAEFTDFLHSLLGADDHASRSAYIGNLLDRIALGATLDHIVPDMMLQMFGGPPPHAEPVALSAVHKRVVAHIAHLRAGEQSQRLGADHNPWQELAHIDLAEMEGADIEAVAASGRQLNGERQPAEARMLLWFQLVAANARRATAWTGKDSAAYSALIDRFGRAALRNAGPAPEIFGGLALIEYGKRFRGIFNGIMADSGEPLLHRNREVFRRAVYDFRQLRLDIQQSLLERL